jgi:hypothetical protein
MRLALLAFTLVVSSQSDNSAPLSGTSSSRDTEGSLLAIKSSFEPLLDTATLSLENGRTLKLEPGVRVTQEGGGYSLATHDGKKLVIQTGADSLVLASPVVARLTDRGWELNGASPIETHSLLARRQNQDDADTNLKSMQEAAKKLKKSSQENQTKLRIRWLYSENPFASDETLNTAAIQQLTHISALGF